MKNSKLVDQLRALGEPTRLELLMLLAEGGEQGGTELLDQLRVSQPSLSRHLKVLRETGVILERREGRNAFYRLSEDPLPRQVLALLGDAGNGRRRPRRPPREPDAAQENMSLREYELDDRRPASPPKEQPDEAPPPSDMEDWML